ncbi:FMN-binding protein [Enterocloster clostridioformis]|uniref:FMN-binding protein n=1 Tax=Enterocloster clostridioformis TaxID=1531 RepID=UPI0008E9CA01|nr:FMN-binding protein [Enterocloster clostridioformis]SFG46763.1 Uncharacterized protein, contains FMN-binding domain [Enterocloster clostridioformis]
MKSKMKKILPYVSTVVITLFSGFVIVAFVLRPQKLEIGAVDLDTVSDGEYVGVCQNKILFAVVKVKVQNHEISDVEVIEHKASYMKQAEQIAENVCDKQSLDVDTISGATLTSDTVLKAIENALEDVGASDRK